MKLRHAAAVALVGCGLMVPPLNSRLPDGVDTDASLGRWQIVGSYDTADDCEIGVANLVERSENNKARKIRLLLGNCIETDDPRLKSK